MAKKLTPEQKVRLIQCKVIFDNFGFLDGLLVERHVEECKIKSLADAQRAGPAKKQKISANLAIISNQDEEPSRGLDLFSMNLEIMLHQF